MPGRQLQQIIKTTLLVALGAFFYSRIANNTLYYYINERFSIFTVIGIGGLVLLGLSYRWDSASPEKEADAQHVDEPTLHTHGHTHTHAHTHTHDHALTWGGIAILALPIILGLAIPPQPLGVAALANRDVTLSMNESALPVGLRQREKSSHEKNIMDWWQEFRIAAATTADTSGQGFAGQPVRVHGFVYKDERFGDDYFFVTRFVVSCCVADANVLALLVHTPQTANLADDQWVEIEGHFTAEGQVEGWAMPIVAADTVTLIDVPNQPYLYP